MVGRENQRCSRGSVHDFPEKIVSGWHHYILGVPDRLSSDEACASSEGDVV